MQLGAMKSPCNHFPPTISTQAPDVLPVGVTLSPFRTYATGYRLVPGVSRTFKVDAMTHIEGGRGAGGRGVGDTITNTGVILAVGDKDGVGVLGGLDATRTHPDSITASIRMIRVLIPLPRLLSLFQKYHEDSHLPTSASLPRILAKEDCKYPCR